ncbi:MAG: hypothetical protein M1451_09615, partial [Acidobacteria bacterium]|nr:hypothetical protein [Acidobacteriota bacterium]
MDTAALQHAIPADYFSRRFSGPLEDEFFGPGAVVSGLDSRLPLSLKIRDRGGNLIFLRPNAAQKQYARHHTKRNIILKARQLGMTTYIAARFFLSTINCPGTVTLQVAHNLEAAQQIFHIVHRFVDHLDPAEMGRIRIVRSSMRELAFDGLDSRYIVDTAGNENAGRGLTI